MTRSIRVRITAVAVLAAALVLTAAGLALVWLQRATLTDGLDQTLTQRADDIEALIESGPPDEIASSANEGFAQVIDRDGSVVTATSNLVESGPLELEAVPVDTPLTIDVPAVDDDRFRVLLRSLEDGSTLIVGTTFDVVTESTSALLRSLSLTIPLLLIVLGTLTWWLVGRTLRPVEAMRSEVAGIEAADLHRRVPVPGTGDEVERLARTMNQMLERLESSLERQQRFAADASHELRSPLTRLRTEIELEIRQALGPIPQSLRSFHEEVIRMQAIVEDLLYLARADAGQIDTTFEPVDLDDVVMAQLDPGTTGVAIRTEGISAAQILGDRLRLGRAVKNLVDNAARHARNEVALELTEVDGWAVLRVLDDGPGIPAGAAETVFQRFTRLDEARTAGSGGTGLGLAIAREVAEAHGGTLEVVNAGVPGAIFELRIPAVGPR